jgi:hypothetical protein
MERPPRLKYPVPWDVIFSLTPHLAHGTIASFDSVTSQIAGRLTPAPLIEGESNLPPDPRFLLVANHYQRKGLWIAHPASVITQMVRRRYGPMDPPVRWVVTANWPPLRLGPIRIASPGDVLLPKVARVLSCYPVSFAKSNPGFTAVSIRRLLRDAAKVQRPIGLFPEGVGGTAGTLGPPLPGVGRLIKAVAKLNLPVVPVGITERDRMVFRVGETIPPQTLMEAEDAASLVMERLSGLTSL